MHVSDKALIVGLLFQIAAQTSTLTVVQAVYWVLAIVSLAMSVDLAWRKKGQED